MKKKIIAIIVPCLVVVLVICAIIGANVLLTNLIESSNSVCKNQKFSSVEEAVQAMETEAREEHDSSLDYCPPYKLLYTFDYDESVLVLYSYCKFFDGEESSSYAVRVLKHNDDGTLSFDGGLADFYLTEPNGNEDYYYFTNINTAHGVKSISFLYLSKETDKDIYVDGVKAEKVLASVEDEEFYICYTISRKDTFLSNLFTPISKRHKIAIK